MISIAVAMSPICRTDTAAIVGSIFHSKYCRIAIGKVVRPGPTMNRLISKLPNEDTKPNSAAATTPGRMAGSVTRRKVVKRSAPSDCAASSMDRSRPMRLAVTNRTLGYDQLRQVVTEVLQRDVMGDLEYRTNWIATVIKCGPLLGLFGTVLGMMAAFGRIGTGEKVQPSQIADEISIALICTAMGLGTAIPFNLMLASLSARIRRFQDALGAGLARALDVMRTRI